MEENRQQKDNDDIITLNRTGCLSLLLFGLWYGWMSGYVMGFYHCIRIVDHRLVFNRFFWIGVEVTAAIFGFVFLYICLPYYVAVRRDRKPWVWILFTLLLTPIITCPLLLILEKGNDVIEDAEHQNE